MKSLFTTVIVFFVIFQIAAQNSILDKKVTIHIENVSVKEILNEISKQTAVGFTYSDDLVSMLQKVSLNVVEKPIDKVLEQLFDGTEIVYKVVGSQVVLYVKRLPAKKFTINGFVSDNETGERLQGIIIHDEISKAMVISNAYGFYSLTVPEGNVKLNFSFIGYNRESHEINLSKNTDFNFQLTPTNYKLNDVTITESANKKRVESTQMGSAELQLKNLKLTPVIGGESDIMKTMQMLPGIQQGEEGSSAVYVRGGSADQNLILLDEAPVYNVNHLFGYMSTFNDDALQSVTVLKGGIPARYGGRLSSVIDIKMKEGSNKQFEAQGSIGTLASRLTLEGPIYSDKTSFIFSARRTYFDLLTRPFFALISKTSSEDIQMYYFFQDYNLKLNHNFSSRSRLYFSIYTGNDNIKLNMKSDSENRFYNENATAKWGNITTTTRWNYKISDKLFCNSTFIFSNYNILFADNFSQKDTIPITQTNITNYQSGIQDYSSKIDFDYFINTNHTIRFGAQSTFHQINPGVLHGQSSIESVISAKYDTLFNLSTVHLIENELYMEDEIRISDRLKTNIGARYCVANVKNKTYQSIQPRVSLRYLFTDNWSAKAAYCMMNQNLNLPPNSNAIGIPLDVWIPTTDILKPQFSNQYSLGTMYNFKNIFEASAEMYYKTMQNVIGPSNDLNFFFTDNNWDSKLVQGKGIAYGAEFLVEKKTGNTFGWMNYTWAKSERQFANINRGRWFPYQYDRRHNLNLMLGYRFSEKFEFGITEVVSSGRKFTVNNQKIPSLLDPGETIETFDSPNNFEAPLYHRMDVSLRFSKEKKWGTRTWTIGCYNLYNHKNASIIFVKDNKLIQLAAMPIIPSITYSFKFKKKTSIPKSSINTNYSDPQLMDRIKRDSLLLASYQKHDSIPTEKGCKIKGLNFNANYYSANKTGAFSLSYTSAKFRTHNFALGSTYNIYYKKHLYYKDSISRFQTAISMGFQYGILSRYYIGNWKTRPFIEITPTIQMTSPINITVSSGIGVSHFISDRVALEAILSDQSIFSKTHNFNFNIGFQIYFPR